MKPQATSTVGTTYPCLCIVFFASFLPQKCLAHLIIIGMGNIRIKYNLDEFLLPICSSSTISSILTIIYTTSVVLAFMKHALLSSNRPKCSAHHATLLATTLASTLQPIVCKQTPLKLFTHPYDHIS